MKWRIGEVTVTKLVELEVTGGSRFVLPQATPGAIIPIRWQRPDFADVHHPCQIAHPEWSSTADSDPVEARLTRERGLTDLADTPILVIGTHLAGGTAGQVVREGDAYRLVE